MGRPLKLCLILLLLLPLKAFAVQQIVAKALTDNMAVLQVDARLITLRTGEEKDGITLIKSSTREALIAIRGKQYSLSLDRSISSNYLTPPASLVRVRRDTEGHYFIKGKINGKPVRFLVDTGATLVAMSPKVADQLGIRFSRKDPIYSMTAGGPARTFLIDLDSVSVGPIKVPFVRGSVVEGDGLDDVVLLGNSFLGKVKLSFDDTMLVMESRL